MNKIEAQPLNIKAVPALLTKGLSETQLIYLDFLTRKNSISATVTGLLGEGRLVSFTELFAVVEKLHQAKAIGNPAFTQFFDKLAAHAKPAAKESLLGSLFKKEKPDEYLRRHPFFRSQNPVLTALFCQHAEVVEVKPGTALCKTGELDRDLFFMIDGEAAIYRNVDGQGRRLVGFFGKDATIGEVGFFMGEHRGADVIVTKPAKVVIVHYNESAFGKMISKDIARGLQTRFRVLHALAKSPFLKNIPEQAMEALVHSGRVRDAREFELICKEGDHGESCYIVVNGSVVISQGAKSVGVLGPGEAFGEIALFFTQGRRTATCMAQRETTVLEIWAHDFYKMLSENILLACEFEKMALARSAKLAQSA